MQESDVEVSLTTPEINMVQETEAPISDSQTQTEDVQQQEQENSNSVSQMGGGGSFGAAVLLLLIGPIRRTHTVSQFQNPFEMYISSNMGR